MGYYTEKFGLFTFYGTLCRKIRANHLFSVLAQQHQELFLPAVVTVGIIAEVEFLPIVWMIEAGIGGLA